MQEYFEKFVAAVFVKFEVSMCCSTFFGQKNILFTFPMIFEILLERSAGRLVLQCNRAWYSLKRGIHQALFHFEREKVNRKYAVLRISEGNAT